MSLSVALDLLRDHYGRPAQRPATALERLLLVLLARQSSTAAASAALANLREAGLIDVASLAATPEEELAELLTPLARPAPAVRRLKRVIGLIAAEHGGSLESLWQTPPDRLREELAALNGIGTETAELIMLEAGDVPVFPVDPAAHRVCKRHGWIDFEATSSDLGELVETSFPGDAATLRDLRFALHEVGRDYCGKEPHCEECPLRNMLPPGGPLRGDWEMA